MAAWDRVAVARDVLEEMELKGIAPTRPLLLALLASTNATKMPEYLGDAVYYFDKARAVARSGRVDWQAGNAGRACLVHLDGAQG